DVREVMKGPLRAMRALVHAPGGEVPSEGVFRPLHDHGHGQDMVHTHDHGHSHVHRNLHDIKHIIKDSDLPPPVKEKAVAVFTRLAHAEAKVHGTTVDKIHFHEVGALDAIVDIVGAVAGVHGLGIQK